MTWEKSEINIFFVLNGIVLGFLLDLWVCGKDKFSYLLDFEWLIWSLGDGRENSCFIYILLQLIVAVFSSLTQKSIHPCWLDPQVSIIWVLITNTKSKRYSLVHPYCLDT